MGIPSLRELGHGAGAAVPSLGSHGGHNLAVVPVVLLGWGSPLCPWLPKALAGSRCAPCYAPGMPRVLLALLCSVTGGAWHGGDQPRCCRGALISGHAGRGHMAFRLVLLQPALAAVPCGCPQSWLGGMGQGCWHWPEHGQAGAAAFSTHPRLSPSGCSAVPAPPSLSPVQLCIPPLLSAAAQLGSLTLQSLLGRGDPRAGSPSPSCPCTGQPQPLWTPSKPQHLLHGPALLPVAAATSALGALGRGASPCAPWCSLVRLSGSLPALPGAASPAPCTGVSSPRWLGRLGSLFAFSCVAAVG